MARLSDRFKLSDALKQVPIPFLIEKAMKAIEEKGHSRGSILHHKVRFNDLKRCSSIFGAERLTEEFVAWYIDEGRQRCPKHARGSVHRKALLNKIALVSNSAPVFVFENKAEKIQSKMLRKSLSDFEQYLKDQSKSSETIKSYIQVAASFLLYLEKKNANDPLKVTVAEISGFMTELGEVWAPRSMRTTPSALRAYLKFVKAQTDTILSLGFSMPRKSKPIRAMGEESVLSLWGYVKGDDDDLRSKAIVAMLLATGIRPVDIANLKLNDISWKNDNFGFVQSKTGEYIEIELFPVLGDAIARYITEQRPKGTGQRYVFLTKKAPFRKMTPSLCNHILKDALEKAGIAFIPDGLHCPRAVRRSLVSRMIAKDVPLQKAAAAIGHVSEDSVHLYTELDVGKMRSICLPVPDSIRGWLVSS